MAAHPATRRLRANPSTAGTLGITRRDARDQQTRNRLQHCVWQPSDHPSLTPRQAIGAMAGTLFLVALLAVGSAML